MLEWIDDSARGHDRSEAAPTGYEASPTPDGIPHVLANGHSDPCTDYLYLTEADLSATDIPMHG